MATHPQPIWITLFKDSFTDLEITSPRINYQNTLVQLENKPELLGGIIRDQQMASCCIGAMWLKADFFEKSHRLFQDIPTPTGSLWHGISHRREGDHGNASYWFARCQGHPACKAVGSIHGSSHQDNKSRSMKTNGNWNYDFFNRSVENRSKDVNTVEQLKNLQETEWRETFLWTLQHALVKVPPID